MSDQERLPRGHAYIRMRHDGYTVNIEYRSKKNPQAERMMKAVMDILKGDYAKQCQQLEEERPSWCKQLEEEK